MSRSIQLVDAFVAAIKPRYGEVRRGVDPWVKREGLVRPQFIAWGDPEGEVREKFGKGRYKETVPVIVSVVANLDNDYGFERLMGLAEDLVDCLPEEYGLQIDGLTWMFDGPAKWRVRYVADQIKEENGVLVGTFVSMVEFPFWRAW